MVNDGFTMVNHMVELPYPENHGSTMVSFGKANMQKFTECGKNEGNIKG